ncbi:MAG: glycyl radical protein [Gemmatimonadetes bacterium]|nr:glycyl radical protein [Gemmatimonadota bacterium]
MTERVKRLRQESLDSVVTLSAERAKLLTDFSMREHGLVSAPVRRALAFRYILENKEIHFGSGELIVGERGPAPKAASTYPEVCCHTEADLVALDSREKISFSVSDETKATYRDDVTPFWSGRTLRDLIMREMTPEWKAAYQAGVFTEFMEQRAPGHTVLDDKIYRKGFLDLIAEIQDSLEGLDFLNDPEAYAKQEQLRAMEIAAEALILYAQRHALKARELAEADEDPERRRELLRIAQVCEHVPAHPPRDFWEAVQAYWFVHIGVITELNTWDAFNPGHLDHHLEPFFQLGLAEGTMTRDEAEELLQCLWVKFNNHPAPPKVGITAEESATYTDFAQVNTGGVRRDGSDAVNEVTYLLLDVIEEMRLLQPSSSVQLSKKNPDRYLKRAGRIIATGFGQPSIFNSDLIVQELIRQGKTVEDAREGGSSGCVEVGAFGKENYNLTGYFNLPKVLELTLNRGKDPRTGDRVGIDPGDPREFGSFEELMAAFERQLRYLVDVKIRGNNVIERLWAEHIPTPFLSLLIDDCIKTGKDYHDGGARYNTSYVQGVGLGTVTDSLTALKHHVFEKKTFPMATVLEALDSDFREDERLRLTLRERTPKYGNDDDYADGVMKEVFETYFAAIDGRPNTKGGSYRINLLPTTVHVYFGSVVKATPDGRAAGTPLSEGISPVQGMDRKGPTAVLKSAAKMDHARTGGTLLNQKLTPGLLETEEGLNKWVHLVRSYFRMDGHHIQFNVVDAETLKAAQANPEQHRDLIVRVAGYSDYFCDLGRTLQDEIIHRTEHSEF